MTFSSDSNALVIDTALLDRPPPASDPQLQYVLDEHANKLLQELRSANTFIDRVRKCIVDELKGGDPGLKNVAKKMGTSERTFRRRLKELDTSHQNLLDELRHELSIRYLTEYEISTDEVAFMLGFSEVRSFRRAFKRWTGRTIKDFRKTELLYDRADRVSFGDR